MNTPDLTTLLVFKNIYEKKNLTVVAELMGLSKPAISKRLEQLELELGVDLFSRTTRSVVPTQEAHNLINKVNEIFEKVEGLNTSLKESKTLTKRKIRISCIASMAQRFLGRTLKEFQNKNPEIEFELIVTDSVLDPVENNIDLMIRTNPNKKSNLVGRKVGHYKLVLVGSSEYLKKHKRIKIVEDLSDHSMLVIDQHLGIFDGVNKSLRELILSKRNFKTNNSPLISQLILEGHGIGVRSSWDVKADIKNKRLQSILSDSKEINSGGEIWILSSSLGLQNDSVRKTFDYLVKELGNYLE